MADISRIKGNVKIMLDKGAPEADIDAYLASESVTPEDLQISSVPAASGILDEPANTGWFRTLVDQFNQGTLAGWGDEATSAIAAAGVAPFVDETFGELYKQGQEISARDLPAQQEESPWLSAGAQIGGALTGAVGASKLIPNGASAKAAQFAQSNPKLAAMLVGGGGAGVYSAGASENEGIERLDNLGTDVPLGALTGYVGSRIAQKLPAIAGNIGQRLGLKKAPVVPPALGGILDDITPPAATAGATAAPAAAAAMSADPLAPVATPMALSGILDDAALARLQKGKVLPLTLGDKTGDVLQQRAEQTAATMTPPTSPINIARGQQKEAMQSPFRRALGDDQLFDDVALSGRLQDEAIKAANIIRGEYDNLGKQVNQAYTKARDIGGGVGIKAEAIGDGFLGSVDDVMAIENVRRGDIPKLDSVTDELREIIEPLYGEGRKAFSLNHIKLNELEAWKKRLNRAIGNTMEPADKRILEMVGRQYDDFLTNMADDAIVNGDETAINAFKNARSLAKKKFSFYESDKAIAKILDTRELSGSQLVNTIMGASKIGGTGEGGRLVDTMLSLAGEKAPAMQEAIRRGYMAKILNDSLGRTPEARSVFDMAGAMQKSLNGLMKNREAFEAVFDETEQKYFRQMSEDLGKIAGKQIGAINRSGSGTYTQDAMSGLANFLANPVFNKMTAGTGGVLSGGIRAGLEKKAAAEIIGKAESGLDDFLFEAIKGIDAPAIYYGSYVGQAGADPLGYAAGHALFAPDDENDE